MHREGGKSRVGFKRSRHSRPIEPADKSKRTTPLVPSCRGQEVTERTIQNPQLWDEGGEMRDWEVVVFSSSGLRYSSYSGFSAMLS